MACNRFAVQCYSDTAHIHWFDSGKDGCFAVERHRRYPDTVCIRLDYPDKDKRLTEADYSHFLTVARIRFVKSDTENYSVALHSRCLNMFHNYLDYRKHFRNREHIFFAFASLFFIPFLQRLIAEWPEYRLAAGPADDAGKNNTPEDTERIDRNITL